MSKSTELETGLRIGCGHIRKMVKDSDKGDHTQGKVLALH